MSTLFRLGTDRFEFVLSGPEAFVKDQMNRFLPALSEAVPAEPSEAEAPAPPSTLAAWYSNVLPAGRAPTMQDAILVFAYYLKREKGQHIFRSSDMKRSFKEVNRKVPKSLLQIMGTLKRDQGLLWSPEDKRGRYALTPKGIRSVEKLLAIRPTGEEEEEKAEQVEKSGNNSAPGTDFSQIDHAPALREDPAGEPRTGSEKWSLLFKEGRR